MGATAPPGSCQGDALKVKRWWMDKDRRWLWAEAGYKTMSCTWIIILVREEDAWSGAAALHHAFVVSLCENHQDGIKSMPRRGDIKNSSWRWIFGGGCVIFKSQSSVMNHNCLLTSPKIDCGLMQKKKKCLNQTSLWTHTLFLPQH